MKDTHKLLPVDSFSGEIGIESKEALIFTSSFLALLKGNLVLFFFFFFFLIHFKIQKGQGRREEEERRQLYFLLYTFVLVEFEGYFFFLLRTHALL